MKNDLLRFTQNASLRSYADISVFNLEVYHEPLIYLISEFQINFIQHFDQSKIGLYSNFYKLHNRRKQIIFLFSFPDDKFVCFISN